MNDNQQTLLVVDDQPENLAILGEMLEPFYRVKVATGGRRAVQSAASEPRPDLILLDVMMPDMDGYEVLTRLRANPLTRDIPVIFVTARGAAEDEERGLEFGAADYITKPVKPAVVLARVHTQLENRRAKEWLKDQNAFLDAEVKRRMRENEIIQSVSLHALAILAETRDSDTGNHIHRTQSYVAALIRAVRNHPESFAQALQDDLDLIVKAAPLHDIGKVGIPDNILYKPGRFSPEEFEIMKRHSRIGGDAIALAMTRVKEGNPALSGSAGAALAFLEVARQIALWHHERWDGGGYPDQLRGEEIPLAARVMAIADVFDALISKRIYKPALPIDEAVEVIRADSGKHFDPFLTGIFLEIQAEFAEIAERFADV